MTSRDLKAQARISEALLDRWSDSDRSTWQFDPNGGHIIPLAASRGGLPEVVGACFFGAFIELLSA